MAKDLKHCDHCGAPMNEYSYKFDKGHASILAALYRLGGTARNEEMGLDKHLDRDVHKLAYWELAEPYTETEDDVRKRGMWRITQKGIDFLHGRTTIIPRAWIYRKNVVRLEGEPIYISSVSDEYKVYMDFVEEARPHIPAEDPAVEYGRMSKKTGQFGLFR